MCLITVVLVLRLVMSRRMVLMIRVVVLTFRVGRGRGGLLMIVSALTCVFSVLLIRLVSLL